MQISVCTYCGSPRVLQDAYVPLNDPDDVRLFDSIICDNCGEKTSVSLVTVPDDFDINTDFYKG